MCSSVAAQQAATLAVAGSRAKSSSSCSTCNSSAECRGTTKKKRPLSLLATLSPQTHEGRGYPELRDPGTADPFSLSPRSAEEKYLRKKLRPF